MVNVKKGWEWRRLYVNGDNGSGDEVVGGMKNEVKYMMSENGEWSGRRNWMKEVVGGEM